MQAFALMQEVTGDDSPIGDCPRDADLVQTAFLIWASGAEESFDRMAAAGVYEAYRVYLSDC